MFRLVLVALAIVPATVYYGFRILWATRKGAVVSDICHEGPRAWARLILRVSNARVVLENTEAIDPTHPQVLVANHVSWYDVLALVAYAPGRSIFVAKKELASVPIFGRAGAACGHIFIDRRDRNSAVASLSTAKKMLEEESPTIIMFPEGTRSATGRLQPFKKGAFVLAIQTGVDVVPAAISGSREVMRKGSLLIRPGTIRVRFGTPISVAGLGVEDRNALTERAWQELAALQGATIEDSKNDQPKVEEQ